MRKKAIAMGLLACLSQGQAADFTLHLTGLSNGSRLSAVNTACRFDPSVEKVVIGPNINPGLSWRNPPKATQSFALMLLDPDVPVPHSDKRRTKAHWVVINIPATTFNIARGQASLTLIGKLVAKVRAGAASVISFGDKAAFAASYLGPCPRQDDRKLHHYRWTVSALDVARLPSMQSIASLQQLIKQHALAQAVVVTTWSNNPTICGRYCQSAMAD